MAIDYIIGTSIETVHATNIRRFIEAFGVQLDQLRDSINDLSLLRQIDICHDNQLDQIGTIVCLSRHDAGVLISNAKLAADDDVYRVLLKYKALQNTSSCTVEDVITACKLMFNAVSVSYSEVPSVPATFWVTITARFSESVLSLLQSHSVVIRPSGVTARIACSDTQYFGFADCDDASLGFGLGELAQSIA